MSEKSWDARYEFRCDVCNNTPDDDGMIEHGRGCYVVDSDGGGETWVCDCDPFEPSPDCDFHNAVKAAESSP